MLHLHTQEYVLRFAFAARTSRGLMTQHKIRYLCIYEERNPNCFGLGECAPLPGLSLESDKKVRSDVKTIALRLKDFHTAESALSSTEEWREDICASICFAVETALLDLQKGGKRKLFKKNTFLVGKGIPINGLVWMGDIDFMWKQVEKKVKEGFRCLKLKVGGTNFEAECELLDRIRANWDVRQLQIRLDANGAFLPEEVSTQLKELSRYGIHSIEQPVLPTEKKCCAKLCKERAIPIALDESLIGIDPSKEGDELLEKVQPQFLVLKPTLLGGFSVCRKWIEKAKQRDIDWWLTSALESNLGLSAIAQFSASLPGSRTEGLGTGQLYTNNLKGPLRIANGHLLYDRKDQWQLPNFDTS